MRGPEHRDTLQSVANVSMRLAQVGQPEAAADMAMQAYVEQRCVLGPEDSDTLHSLCIYDLCHAGQKAAEMAVELLQELQALIELEPDAV